MKKGDKKLTQQTMSTRIQSGSDDRKSQENNDINKNGKAGEQTLHTLLEAGMRDIYSAEKQLVEALQEVIQAVDNDELEEAISTHLEQTRKQVMRLEKSFERMGLPLESNEKCVAMEGLIEETRKVIREFHRGPVRDAALIIGAQKIEHYEIAVYGSLCELADVLGDERLGDLLGRTLEEEEEADELLSEIAKDVNDEAAEVSMHEEEYH
jgi:ferritin-like metal-binding protein YciE